jgi:hypothetical protein
MTWPQGRAVVEAMLRNGRLERVPPNRDHADHLIAQAHQHLAGARAVVAIDPTGAYQLIYDAARKSLSAVLENQGLRVTSRGGHVAVLEAVVAQLDPPLGPVLNPFDRLRRRRNQAEYPSADAPALAAAEVANDLPKVVQIVAAAADALDRMGPF